MEVVNTRAMFRLTGRNNPITRHVSAQAVSSFLLQHNYKLFVFKYKLMNLLLTGEDQSQADQPNNLAEGYPM